jgi:DNA polymerase III subunit epsilon
MPHLSADPDFRATTFVVIDFEATTPTGRSPEPIEVAAVALRFDAMTPREIDTFEALMRPPTHAPVTRFDTEQTGITPQMLADRPAAQTVLAELDKLLTAPPYLLVAHNANVEGNLIYARREACPVLAHTQLLDTVKLSRVLLPDLPGHSLDWLLSHFAIPRPANRHRAMADVRVTIEVIARLLAMVEARGDPPDLRALLSIAGHPAKATKPVQETIFDV